MSHFGNLNSDVLSASARRVVAEPGRSGCGWLAGGAGLRTAPTTRSFCAKRMSGSDAPRRQRTRCRDACQRRHRSLAAAATAKWAGGAPSVEAVEQRRPLRVLHELLLPVQVAGLAVPARQGVAGVRPHEIDVRVLLKVI